MHSSITMHRVRALTVNKICILRARTLVRARMHVVVVEPLIGHRASDAFASSR